MGQTTKYKFPYPESSDNADVPKDMKNLAESIEGEFNNFDTKKADASVVDEIKKSSDEIRKLANVGIKNVTYNPTNGVMTFIANDGSSIKIDLPLELLIETGTYNSDTKTIILTLANGDDIEIPIGDLITDFYNKEEIDQKIDSVNKKIDKENENINQQIAELDRRVNNLEKTTGIRYEVERKIIDIDGTIVTTPIWTRLYDAIGLVANATHDGSEVENTYDEMPIYRDIISAEIDNNGNILHYYDEDDYNPESGNNIMTILPDMYIARYHVKKVDGIYERRGIASQKFSRDYRFFSEKKLARYEGYLDNENKLKSISGKVPAYLKNIVQFRTYARNNGSEYEMQDIWTRYMLESLYLVEYANSNSQLILGNGIMSWLGDNIKSLVAENSVNRIIVATNTTLKSRLYEGKCISIGTSSTWNGNVCRDRKVTSVEDYTDGTITGMAVYFDGTPVNIAIGNTLWGSAQATGQCDSLGMKSGCLVNDGVHSVIYRGIENPFGNMWEFIDGINCKAGNETYVCRNHKEYASNVFTEPYKLIGYTKADLVEGWTKQMGYDEENPEIALPIEVGASNTTGYCDYYYNKNSTSNRIARVGGCFNGGTLCGFFCWYFSLGSGDNGWHIGARLLKYQK